MEELVVLLGIIVAGVAGQPTTLVKDHCDDQLRDMEIRIRQVEQLCTRKQSTEEEASETPRDNLQSVDENVRLVGSKLPRAGRLEVQYDGQWGTVCDDGFGGTETTVLCKSLGYSTGILAPVNIHLSGTTLNILLDDVSCDGDEKRLVDCFHSGYGYHDCDHTEDVVVECYPRPLGDRIHYLMDVEHDTVSKGIQYLGYISQDDTYLTTVSCSNLLRDLPGGFANGAELLAAGGNFGCKQSTDGLDDPGRTGACQPNYQQSTSLASCMRCTHMFICIDYPGASDIRLAGFSQIGRGRVELFHDGLWGTVCGTGFGAHEAIVVCRQMGFMLGYPSSSTTTPTITEDDGPVWLGGVKCTGAEHKLTECDFPGWGVHKCTQSQDAGITCHPGPCGSLLHYHRHVNRGGVPQDFEELCFIRRNQDANLLHTPCHDLVRDLLGGYDNSRDLLASGGSFSCWMGEDRLSGVTAEEVCRGVETTVKLADCSECNLMIVCINYPTTTTLRLADGDDLSGRLEILHDGSWGAICDDSFTDTAASVACRSLGFHYGVIRESGPIKAAGVIWLDEVKCQGDESQIEDCLHAAWGIHDCGHVEDIWVSCEILAPN